MSDADKEEAFVRKLLRKRDRVEALGWMDGATPPTYRNLGESPAPESLALIKRLYAMGAKEVFVVDIRRNGIYESSEKLILRLPEDPAERRKVFSWANIVIIRRGFDPNEDYGQEYLFVGLG
jgi:hypothetical protein